MKKIAFYSFIMSLLCSFDVYYNNLPIEVPKFFTPNNDGINDTWKIDELINYPAAEVYIFDASGRLLFQLNNKIIEWNGQVSGVNMPATDYWYEIRLSPETPSQKGHFTLKR
jgi:gliding motility-associated-like protein